MGALSERWPTSLRTPIGVVGDSPLATLDRALELAQKGVQLNDSIPQTYWSLGYAHMMRKEYAIGAAGRRKGDQHRTQLCRRIRTARFYQQRHGRAGTGA